MLQVTRAAFICTEPADAIDAMRLSFDAAHAVRLPAFFGPDLLREVREAVRATRFSDREDEGLARERCMEPNTVLALLFLIMNDPHLFDVIRRITGCPPIGSFAGRIYSLRSKEGHYDRWHSDVDGRRLIGISVNLGEETFAGGRFELRPACAPQPTWSLANVGPGDAVLFRIADTLQHRVTDVEGDIARVAFAGWFQSHPEFLAVLKGSATETPEVY